MYEEWRQIPGFEKYEVSNLGHVRRKWGRHYKLLKPSVNLSVKGRQTSIGVHDLMLMAFGTDEPEILEDSVETKTINQKAIPVIEQANVWDSFLDKLQQNVKEAVK